MDSPSSEMSTRSQSVIGGIEPLSLIQHNTATQSHGYSNTDAYSLQRNQHNTTATIGGKPTHQKQMVVTAGMNVFRYFCQISIIFSRQLCLQLVKAV